MKVSKVFSTVAFSLLIVFSSTAAAQSSCNFPGSTKYEWIRSVQINNIINNSSGKGYEDFTTTNFSVNQGSSVSLNLVPGFSGSSYFENWTVFADFNQDGKFDDSTEKVFSSSSRSNITGNFLVPNNAILGRTKLRVAMQYGSAPKSCPNGFFEGEIEDYSITLTLPTNVCTPGSLDPTFGDKGAFLNYDYSYKEEQHIAIQTDGKIVLTSNKWGANSTEVSSVTRLTSDGLLDLSYGNNGTKDLPSPFSFYKLSDLTTDSKNRTLVGSSGYAGGGSNVIARLDSSGNMDRSFGVNGSIRCPVVNDLSNISTDSKLIAQPDGKILALVRPDQPYSGGKVKVLHRFLENGSPDNSFGQNGTIKLPEVVKSISDIKITNSGNIFLGGSILNQHSSNQSIKPNEDILLLKLLTNGTLDQTFGVNGIVIESFNNQDDSIKSIVVIGDEEVVAAAEVQTGADTRLGLIKFLKNGKLNQTFATKGLYLSSDNRLLYPSNILVDKSNNLVVIGAKQKLFGYGGVIQRFLPEGIIDIKFGDKGFRTFFDRYGAEARGIIGGSDAILDANGKILFAGFSVVGTNLGLALTRTCN